MSLNLKTEIYVFENGKISLRKQKDLQLETERHLFGNEKICLRKQKDMSLKLEIRVLYMYSETERNVLEIE